MGLSTDRITSVLGVVVGALHQASMVGTATDTPQFWLHTAGSIAFAVLGYYINKH